MWRYRLMVRYLNPMTKLWGPWTCEFHVDQAYAADHQERRYMDSAEGRDGTMEVYVAKDPVYDDQGRVRL